MPNKTYNECDISQNEVNKETLISTIEAVFAGYVYTKDFLPNPKYAYHKTLLTTPFSYGISMGNKHNPINKETLHVEEEFEWNKDDIESAVCFLGRDIANYIDSVHFHTLNTEEKQIGTIYFTEYTMHENNDMNVNFPVFYDHAKLYLDGMPFPVNIGVGVYFAPKERKYKLQLSCECSAFYIEEDSRSSV